MLRRIGAEKERYGSISFSLKRFQRAAAQTYLHWVTLYDSLDDDLFEGQLGIDDDFDYPKVLLEYSVVSSKFTSMINGAEQLGGAIDQVRRKQAIEKKQSSRLPNQDKSSTHTRSQRTTAKAVRTVNVSQTVEFVETRAAKVTGQRAAFEGRVLSDAQQELYQLHRDQDT